MTPLDTATAYKEVVAKIVEVVPEILIATHCVHYGFEENKVCSPCAVAGAIGGWKTSMRKYRPITLEDVLRALPTFNFRESSGSTEEGTLFLSFDNLEPYGNFYWHLGKSLEWHRDSKPETILFLHTLLHA